MSCFFSSRFLFSAGGPAAITVASYCVSVARGVLIDRPESSGAMFGHRMTLPTSFASILRPTAQLISSIEASLPKAKFQVLGALSLISRWSAPGHNPLLDGCPQAPAWLGEASNCVIRSQNTLLSSKLMINVQKFVAETSYTINNHATTFLLRHSARRNLLEKKHDFCDGYDY